MDKYYIPSIEEFYAGFEYEEKVIIYTDKGWFTHKGLGWEKRVFSSTNYMENYYLSERVKLGLVGKYNTTIRVKYLDKDDLEELGFTQVPVDNLYIGHFKQLYSKYGINKENKQYGVSIFFDNIVDNNYIKIYSAIAPEAVHGHLENSHCSFRGCIKNKSELIKLLKQLGIDNNE